ncbi:MAG: T9SS type A sorting domain-containing protein [Melioribacteraceae bacterium]|nr:T9SS type A sorting domain-containing protein [Melioribacteraceae bacterium]
MGKNKLQYSTLLFFFLMIGLTFTLNAQDTFTLEAEDFTIVDPADVDSSYIVFDDEFASNGKYLRILASTTKVPVYAGYEFTATSSTDTVYYCWVKTRPWNNLWNSNVNKVYINWSVPQSIIDNGGGAFPFQGMTYNAMFSQIAAGDTLEWRWYMITDAATAEPVELHLQPGTQNFFWRFRAGVAVYDQIKITNDLNWRPDITFEMEAEYGSLTSPFITEYYSGASTDSVVAAESGSGTVAQNELTKGNNDLTVLLTQASGDYYLWLLVDFPSESSNSYWIGKGDEQLMPPSWEGAVTSNLEWRLVEVDGAAKVFSFTPGAWHNGEILRIKQQEEGTKIDKILLTNNINYNPVTNVEGGTNELLPKSFTVLQNYPNPFNPSTTITYALPEAGDVEVNVYSIIGEKITTLVKAHQSAGVKNVVWNAGNLSSGIYFYSVKYGDKISNKKMLLLK